VNTYYSNNLRSGLKIIFKEEPFLVESSNLVKPGKGQAFVRVKLRRLLTGKLIEKTFKATDVFYEADVTNINVIFLYNDKKIYHFMNTKNFDQLSIDKKVLSNRIQWFLKGETYSAIQWNNTLISVFPNNFIELKVIDIQFRLKNDTASSGSKFAKLSTGVIVKVPIFIQINDIIKVDTRSGMYISRIKN